MVSGRDNLRVVLHDNHRVAPVADLAEDLEQAGVITRMQTDRWLIENKQGVDEGGPESSRQVDPLHLSPREGTGLPVQRQVPETDRLKVTQAR